MNSKHSASERELVAGALGARSSAFTKCGWLTLVCCVLAAIAGCGKQPQVLKDRATVSGTVTFNGKPLPAGTISFLSANGPVTAATSIWKDGNYTTDRAPVGKNIVTIDTTSVKFGNPAAFVPIPAKYSEPDPTGFTADLKPGVNENVDFKLEK